VAARLTSSLELTPSNPPHAKNREPSNGGGDKTDIIGGIAGMAVIFTLPACDNRGICRPSPPGLPHRSLSFPLWTVLSSQRSSLNVNLGP